MSTAYCFECGEKAHHNHHVVPKTLGGTRTIPLCETCHGKVHRINFKNHSYLIKMGLKRAKALGKTLGRQRYPISTKQFNDVAHLSIREAAKALGVSRSVIHNHRLRA